MKLADFIESHYAAILSEWEVFASTSAPSAQGTDPRGLRDHARAMLETIVADLRTPQTAAQELQKSRGNSDSQADTADTAAETHGAGRAESGFSVGEMVSEYRALRASVMRLWIADCGMLNAGDLQDLIRFNEAIDQATAESITRYTVDLAYAKEMFLAILGHDLRSPLGAITMASQFMLDTDELQEPHRTLALRIAMSARRMSQMVGDLLDFTRGRLGTGIPVSPAPMDLDVVVRHVVDEVAVARGTSAIQYNASGDLEGRWDASRISQMVSNLLNNAVEHGTAKSRIDVTLQGESNDVILRVHNYGHPIGTEDLSTIFSPFKRVAKGGGPTSNLESIGLGLYIAERIAAAHGGTIDVRSSAEAGTLFTVRIPRVIPAEVTT